MALSSNQEIESRGATVDAAVSVGLQRLGVERDRVKVIIIDEGSRGLLGIGSREAIVRLIVTPVEVAPKAPASPAPQPSAPPAPVRETPKPKPTPPAKPVERPQARAAQPADEGDEDDTSSSSEENLETEQQAAIEIISELLDKMHVQGRSVDT